MIDHALMNDYSLWASDVSEEGFSFRQGMALVPLDGAKIKKSGKDNKLLMRRQKKALFLMHHARKEITQKCDNLHLTITKPQTITGCI